MLPISRDLFKKENHFRQIFVEFYIKSLKIETYKHLPKIQQHEVDGWWFLGKFLWKIVYKYLKQKLTKIRLKRARRNFDDVITTADLGSRQIFVDFYYIIIKS